MVPVLWMPLLRGVLANTRDRFSSESELVVRVREECYRQAKKKQNVR